MDKIEGKRFEASDPKDSLFFNRAIEVCRGHLHDKNLAYRVYNFLNLEDNYRLIGDSLKESVF
jgi:pentatricopeptide repeat domain-containing protein 3